MRKRSRGYRVLLASLLLFLLLAQSVAAARPLPPPAPHWVGQPAFQPGEVLVALRSGVMASALDRLLPGYQATRIGRVFGTNTQIVRVPEGQEYAIIERLRASPLVRYVEPNYLYHIASTPDDPYLSKQWGLTRTQALEAWDLVTGTSQIVIAIIDTGIDETHPDLAAKLVPGYDFVEDDADPHDLHGHGTHVAGIAAAVTDNGLGVASVAWGARIMPLRVLNKGGVGDTSDVASAIHWARVAGADILNLSLAGSSTSQTLQDAITQAHDAGLLVVAAMGNEGNNTPLYPAANAYVMAVAATTPTDQRAPYSNYGTHCDIAAPGGAMSHYHDPAGIYSTLPGYSVTLTTEDFYSPWYDFLQGTSQATPFVAGLAALIWSANPTLSPDEVQQLIQDTAVDLGASGWDPYYGHGRIDMQSAVACVLSPDAPELHPITNHGDPDYQVVWSGVSGAAGYRLQEARSWDFADAVTYEMGAGTSFQATGREGGVWIYRVQAYDCAGDSDWSPPRSVTVRPAAPVLDPIVPLEPDAYRLSWSQPAGATGYRLQEAPDISFTSVLTRYLGSSQVYTMTGQPNGTWYYRVAAYNAGGFSPPSEVESVTVTVASVEPPCLDSISNDDHADSYQVTWSWSVITAATVYTLEESRTPYFELPRIAYTGTLTTYLATGQGIGTWHYRVRGATATARSPWSDLQSTMVITSTYLPVILHGFSE